MGIEQNGKAEEGIFNHFPSPLFRTSIRNNLKSENGAINRSSFFFPSNKVKTDFKRTKSRECIRPSSSLPARKLQTKKFNLDGTFQNHQIQIPKRAQSSYCPKRERGEQRKDLLSFAAIAKECLLRREKRRLDKEQKILPWSSIGEGDHLNRSVCNSIREEF
jgi:hypothetical protein